MANAWWQDAAMNLLTFGVTLDYNVRQALSEIRNQNPGITAGNAVSSLASTAAGQAVFYAARKGYAHMTGSNQPGTSASASAGKRPLQECVDEQCQYKRSPSLKVSKVEPSTSGDGRAITSTAMVQSTAPSVLNTYPALASKSIYNSSWFLPGDEMDSIGILEEGTNNGQRIGTIVTINSIDQQAHLMHTIGSTEPEQFVRVILVFDKQSNGSTLSQSSIVNDPLSIIRDEDRVRYVTIFDEVYHLNDYQAKFGTAAFINQHVDCQLPVVYNNLNDGAETSIVQGTLWLGCISSEITAGYLPSFTYKVRIGYSDS